jgi:hypothetical protein
MFTIYSGWLVENVTSQTINLVADETLHTTQEPWKLGIAPQHWIVFQTKQLVNSVQWCLRLYSALNYHDVAHDFHGAAAGMVSVNDIQKPFVKLSEDVVWH